MNPFILVLTAENWEDNYLFSLNNNNLVLLNNAKYVSEKNAVEYDPAYLQTRKTAFKENVISLLENYTDEEGLTGWNCYSYEFVILNISEDEIERVFQRKLEQFGLSLCSYDDGRLRVDMDYYENGFHESYDIFLFIDEDNIHLDNYELLYEMNERRIQKH
jgi:hypothetical protein